ncbi:DnaD domain protein [Chengkuizengella sp. SCS-71B]|uniref:DnaD domain protein n=1 Tax=Chengkuizengella sp. SCS-71B TaxID=3115290 RepID=UPI0032C23AD6
MKEAYYFSHDANARHDPKILAMRSVYGMEGYGRYWVLIEFLREQTQYKLRKSKHLCNALAMQMQCTVEEAQNFLNDCINEFDLLVENDEFIWSDSLLKRMSEKDKKSEKAKLAAKKRWDKASNNKGSMQDDKDSNTDAMQTHSEGKALKERKVKEKKVKESKEKEIVVEESKEKKSNNTTTTTTDENCFKIYQNEIGILSSSVSDDLNIWLDDFNGDHRVIIQAIKIAVDRNKRNMGFIKGILKEWYSKNARTLEDCEALQKEFENKKNNRNQQQRWNYGHQKPKIPIIQYTENSDAEFTQEQLDEIKKIADEWDNAPVAAGIDLDDDRPF